MKELWTGELVGKMHVAEVTLEELGAAMGVKKSYISMILNGRKTPANAKERLNAAFDKVMAERGKKG